MYFKIFRSVRSEVGEDPILNLSDTLFVTESQKKQLDFVKEGGLYKTEPELVKNLVWQILKNVTHLH